MYGFLLVGHTHEDVDQFFSRIARWLWQNNVFCLPKLLGGMCNFFKDSRKKQIDSRLRAGTPMEHAQSAPPLAASAYELKFVMVWFSLLCIEFVQNLVHICAGI